MLASYWWWLLTDSDVVDGITAVWHKHFECLCRVALKKIEVKLKKQ